MGTLTNYVESNFLLHLIAGDEDAARNAVAELSTDGVVLLHHHLRRAMLLADEIWTQRLDEHNEAAYQAELKEE